MSYFPGSTLRTHGVGGPSSSTALMNLHANGNTSTAAAAPARTRTNPSRISKTTSRSLFPGQTTYSGPLTSLLADPYGNVTSISPSGGLELNSRGHGLGHGQGHGNAQGYAHSGGPAHGIYPAITHFTDAIGALPREFQRHASLLKEVNSKAWRLEEVLPAQLDAAVRSTPFADAVGRYLEEDEPISASVNYDSEEGIRRRKLFGELRATLSELIVTADEKNHVLWNANNELQKHAYRLDTVYPYVQGEVSEEARLGSTTHWAYSKKTDKPARTSERPRREAANHHHHHGADGDGRREGQRKQRRGHADDDERPAGKRANTNTSTSTASKRRRVEKPAPATHTAAAMERSVSAATIGARATSKDVSTIEAKKRGRGPANNVNKRPNTAASVIESPHLPSSPAPQQPAQPAVKAPSPPAARPPSSRAQAPAPLNGRQQPQSAASNRPQTNGKPGNNKPSPLVANDSEVPAPGVNGEGKAKPDAVPKREEIVSSNSNGRPRSEPLELATSGPPPRSRSSKTSTPIAPASEALPPPPPQRTRSLRTANGPRNAQHKKRGSVASSHNLGSDDESYREPRVDDERKGEDDDEDDESEPRYCYCNQVSYGEMVACDNDACPREWFHLSCVGLAKSPAKNEKWYCNECKEGMRRGRSGGK